VVTVDGDDLFVGTQLLPHASLVFHGLVRAMQERGIDSVTILPGATGEDLGAFAAFVAGASSARPARGTVRLNERPFLAQELERRPVSELRDHYRAGLDALRRFTGGLALDLGRTSAVVDGFLAGGEPRLGGLLLLATSQNGDEIVAYHSVNVCVLSLALGRFIGLDEEALRLLGLGALLHDVGRIARADGIAEKRERLTGEDWSSIRLHPQEGAAIILAAARRGEEGAARVALEHHLRMDGGGYPEMPGVEPHLFARLVAVADAYDAITSDRPHRPGRSGSQALRMLADGAGSAHDGDLVDAFHRLMGPHPPGSLLHLSDGELALVVAGDPGETRVAVVQDAGGRRIDHPVPFSVDSTRIAGEVTPARAGLEPGGLLEGVSAAVPAG
jgi:HD-GYP domain-containing protein (c-di-GMP phosphodiesterase class II)